MQAIEVEIEYLKNGQSRIENAIDKQGGKLDSVVDALTALVRMSEKHDALEGRVAKLEKSSDEREEVASSGRHYMAAAKYLAPLVVAALISAIGWLGQRLSDHDIAIKNLEVSHAESHPKSTR